MPYINKEDRELHFNSLADELAYRCNSKGDVTYVVSRIVHKWVMRLGKRSYKTLSKGASVLRDALMCYDATVLLPYEDKKKSENGPVSELDK